MATASIAAGPGRPRKCISLDILSVPASSTLIKQVFSVEGEAKTVKRNRLCDTNLEWEMLMIMNDLYLPW